MFRPFTGERSPGFTASLLPNRAIRHNLGASATVWFPLPVTAGGFHMVGSLATLSLGLIHRFNLSAYSSVLCLLAHRTFPRGNALPVGYLARRASTRIGLQPIRSGDYPATPTPPFQGGEKVVTSAPTNPNNGPQGVSVYSAHGAKIMSRRQICWALFLFVFLLTGVA